MSDDAEVAVATAVVEGEEAVEEQAVAVVARRVAEVVVTHLGKRVVSR